jgi:hypothetical protein
MRDVDRVRIDLAQPADYLIDILLMISYTGENTVHIYTMTFGLDLLDMEVMSISTQSPISQKHLR